MQSALSKVVVVRHAKRNLRVFAEEFKMPRIKSAAPTPEHTSVPDLKATL